MQSVEQALFLVSHSGIVRELSYPRRGGLSISSIHRVAFCIFASAFIFRGAAPSLSKILTQG